MLDKADVAVIIVSWNSAGLLKKVFVALEKQIVKPKKILVIDNGSSDLDDLKLVVKEFPHVQLLSLPENLGFAAANNIGIDKCHNVEFIAFLNPDAFPEPCWLKELVETAKNYTNYASFASRLLSYSNTKILDGAGDNLNIFGKPSRRGFGKKSENLFLKLEPVFCPSAAAALYRREALLDVGGLDEDYFCYIEDVDLGFRLQLAGHKCLYVPTAVALHMGSATTGGQHSDFSVYHGHRNLVWLFVKNMPGVLFWLLLPLHFLLNIVTIVLFFFKGQGGRILLAKKDALLGLPIAWKKRKKIQKNRQVSLIEVWKMLNYI